MKNFLKQLGLLIAVAVLPGILYSQTVEINSKAGFQEIDGFGDCSMYGHLRNTYGYFNETQPEKLDEIADMLFTTQHADSSFGFRFFHQVGIDFCIDETTMEYLPKSTVDNSDVLWYHQKLVERGGKVGLRHPVVDNFKYLDDQGRARISDEDIPASVAVIANAIEGISNDYGYTFFEYTPMNESSASWWGSLNGGDAYLSNAQTVMMINEARTALDNKGLTDVGLAAFDAFYINNHGRLDNMLNSDARQNLDHLSYHQYQNEASSQRYWYEQGSIKHGLKIWQTEWGNWDDLGKYESHAQALTYAKHIFKTLNVGKVSGWLAWEIKFIFDINEQGWFPKEGAWVMAQFSRFADPGMVMIPTSNMDVDNQGTLAFIEPGSGNRDMSIISVNADATDKVLEYDLSAFTAMQVIDARITSESDAFRKIDADIDADNKVLRMHIPAESTVSVRLNVDGDEILGVEADVYQAEDYSSMSSDNIFNKTNSGYTGLGYIDLGDVNSYIEWNNVYSNQSESATLVFQYTNGASDDVTAQVSTNGSNAGTISFTPTGGWGVWSEEQITVNLNSGNNTVRLTGNSTNNRPIIDKVSVYFDGIVPASNVTATANSANQITLNWQDNSSNETSYIIERKLNEGSSFSQIATLSANSTSYTNGSLTSNTNYIYRVVASNSSASEGSETASAKTSTAISAPGSLAITAVNAGSISLNWSDNTSNEDGFIICRREGITGYYEEYDQVSTNTTNYTDNTVRGNTEYTYMVKSFDGSDKSDGSNEVSTIAEGSVLSPSNLALSVTQDTELNLTWSDNSNNETGFVIQRAVGLKYWETIATVSANTTSFIDGNLIDPTTYYYKVQAFNANNVSTWSDEASISLSNPGPTDLSVSTDFSENVLSWVDNSDIESGYVIERKEDDGSYTELTKVYQQNLTTYTDANTTSGVTYTYRVSAFVESMEDNSSYSNVGIAYRSDGNNQVQTGMAYIIQEGTDETWGEVHFSEATSSTPVVVMGPPSFVGDDALTIRIKDISNTGFKYQLREWAYQGAHTYAENVSFIAMVPGTHDLNGVTAVTGIINNVNTSFITENYNSNFSSTPIVIAAQASDVGSDPTAIRLRNVNSSSFEIKIQEEENLDDSHYDEVIHYIAFSQGQGSILGQSIETGSTGLNVDENWYTLNFNASYSSPGFLGSIQTEEGEDPVSPRHNNLTANSVELLVQEEQSADDEVGHSPENIGYLVMANIRGDQDISLPGVAANPNPSDEATNVNTSTSLTWSPGEDATSHDVYFGTSNPPSAQGNQTGTSFNPGTLAENTTYYWRIDEVNSTGTTTGQVWSFITEGGAQDINMGQITVSMPDGDTWISVSFDSPMTETPVVVLGPPTYNGSDPLTTRIRNVTNEGFEFKLDEWNYLDGSHTSAETVSYLAMLPGTHNMGGVTAVAFSQNNVDEVWDAVSFGYTFGNTPAVVATQVTNSGSATTAIRFRNITTSSFEVRIQEEENQDDLHNNETISIIAFSQGSGTLAGHDIRVGVTGSTYNHEFNSINFGGTYTNPGLLANIQTFVGGDPSALRYQNLSNSSVEVMIEEEQSADDEVNHNNTEAIGWVVIEEVNASNNVRVGDKSSKLAEISKSIRFYPNPVDDVLHITGVSGLYDIAIFSVTGSQIPVPVDEGSIDVSKLSKGVYVLRLNNEYTFRFLKK